jgi:hypothetical protein
MSINSSSFLNKFTAVTGIRVVCGVVEMFSGPDLIICQAGLLALLVLLYGLLLA